MQEKNRAPSEESVRKVSVEVQRLEEQKTKREDQQSMGLPRGKSPPPIVPKLPIKETVLARREEAPVLEASGSGSAMVPLYLGPEPLPEVEHEELALRPFRANIATPRGDESDPGELMAEPGFRDKMADLMSEGSTDSARTKEKMQQRQIWW